MNYDAVKVKLHDYIEHAEHEKVMAVYTLVGNDMEGGVIYDETTLQMLEARRNDMLSDKEKTYTLEQTIENLRRHRNKNGV